MFVVFLWTVCHGVVGCGLLDFVRVSFDLTDSDFALMTTCFKNDFKVDNNETTNRPRRTHCNIPVARIAVLQLLYASRA